MNRSNFRNPNPNRRVLSFEPLSGRLLMAADIGTEPAGTPASEAADVTFNVGGDTHSVSAAALDAQAPTNRFDVNDDGRVSVIDALVVSNLLNGTNSTGPFESDLAPHSDVNGDGYITALDLLQVINQIARQRVSEPGDTNDEMANIAPSPIRAESEEMSTLSRLDVDGSGIVDKEDAYVIVDDVPMSDPTSVRIDQSSENPIRFEASQDSFATALDEMQGINQIEKELE